MNQEERRSALAEIVKDLQRRDPFLDLSEALDAFDTAFRQAAESRGCEYNEPNGRARKCLFFYPFSENSAQWCSGIEILDTVGHYVIFERSCKCAMYIKNGPLFGANIYSNPPDNVIAKLEGRSDLDLISIIVDLSVQNAHLLESNRRHLDHIALLHAHISNRPHSFMKRLFSSIKLSSS